MSNTLFPIFLKTEEVHFLIIGGGNVGLEKAETLLRQNEDIHISIVAKNFHKDLLEIIENRPNVVAHEKPYEDTDLHGKDFVIIATDDNETNQKARNDAKNLGIKVNAADMPYLCDFYLGSIVKKGNLKIAISTNGKSPTIAKRLKETFDEALPEEIDDVITNINQLRTHLSGDFKNKVKILNTVTQNLSKNPKNIDKYLSQLSQMEKSVEEARKARRILNNTLAAMGAIIAAVVAVFIIMYFNLWTDISFLLNKENNLFYWMILTGFTAEIVAGSMGMGYGVICTTILLTLGVAPPIVSASIHSAESFTSLAGSISHFKLRNVNKKMVKKLVLPAVIGSLAGVFAISYIGESYSKFIKPIISLYTLYLGFKIFQNSIIQKETVKNPKKRANFNALGSAGGFIDSFTGGGWGPLVTGTLVKNGYTPRYVVGSSTVAKCVLTIFSAAAFIYTIGIQHWNIVAGLLLGGIVTAPFSAKLTSKLPPKKMFLVVGVLVMILSVFSIFRVFLQWNK